MRCSATTVTSRRTIRSAPQTRRCRPRSSNSSASWGRAPNAVLPVIPTLALAAMRRDGKRATPSSASLSQTRCRRSSPAGPVAGAEWPLSAGPRDVRHRHPRQDAPEAVARLSANSLHLGAGSSEVEYRPAAQMKVNKSRTSALAAAVAGPSPIRTAKCFGPGASRARLGRCVPISLPPLIPTA
jgi:hypothetical protein